METKFDLTEEQKRIIESKSEIKKVIACAGSGKTSVLTANLIKILKEKSARPGEVLALTFTNNAAENMMERIRQNFNNEINSDDINIYTFNSFGNFIIKENSFVLGFGKNFKLINEVQSWQIIYDIFKIYRFKKLKAGKDIGKFVSDLLDYIWNLKNNLITIENLKNYINSYSNYLTGYKSSGLRKEEEDKIPCIDDLYHIYENYEIVKRKNNFIDYSDQVFLPYFLFKNHPSIKEKYSQRYKYIFVDEFQDTNNAQAYLLSMIFAKGKNKLMVVGDDDQGIYGFRGACIENIQNFSYFGNNAGKLVDTFFLTTNFRSGKEIIDFTNSIISENKNREKKIVKSESGEKKSLIMFFKKNSLEQEAGQISEMINNLILQNYKLSDIAVLCRRKRFNEIIKSFKKNNIRYELVGSKSYFYEPEIIFLISWLKLIHNINDDEALVYLLKSSKFKISDRDIFFLRNESNKKYKDDKPDNGIYNNILEGSNHALIEAVKNAELNQYVSRAAKGRLKLFIDELNQYIKNSQILNLNGIISFIFHFSGLYDELNSRFGIPAKKKIINVENLIKLAWEFEDNNFDSNFDSFVIYLKDMAKADYEDPDVQVISKENSVKIMSIHAAKGLEFKVVFLPILWEQDYKPRKNQKKYYELPSPLRKDGKIWTEKGNYESIKKFEDELKSIMLEEEKRIFYVAGSRAKELLILSYPQYENYSDTTDSDINNKNMLSFIRNIFAEDSNIVFIGSETLDYLDNAFGFKPAAYSNDFKTVLENFIKIKNDKDKLNNNKTGLQKYKNKTVKEVILLNEYEKLLAENINMVSDNSCNSSRYEIYNLSNIKRENNILTEDKFFSLTEILTFFDCPLLYKFRYVMNMPEPENQSADYGVKMHKFIENITSFYFNNCLNLKNENDGKSNMHNFHLSRIVFDKESVEEMKFKNYINNFFNSGILNFDLIGKIFLEQLFYWKINDFYLICKIDRIDMINNGLVRLYDYKTSSSKNHDHNDNYIFQLKSYICGLSDLFNMEAEKITGSLFFLEDGVVKQVCVKNSEKSDIKNKISEGVHDIKNQKYTRHSMKNCSKLCNFKNLCF
ncbi:ATP-dependent helicase [bacterium]|nr:ATP-dependent helicase [bacterium]